MRAAALLGRDRRVRGRLLGAAVLRHEAFSTGRFDLGNMTQAVWSTAHGDPLGDEPRRRAVLAARRALRPPLSVFAPLWWSGPSPRCCSSLQAVASRSARRRSSGSAASTSLRAGALGFALVYLLTRRVDDAERVPSGRARDAAPPVRASGTSTRTGSSPFAAFAAARRRDEGARRAAVAALGLWYALARGRRRAGLADRSGRRAVSRSRSPSSCPHFARRASRLLRALRRGRRLAGRDRRDGAHRPAARRCEAPSTGATAATCSSSLLPLAAWPARAAGAARRRCRSSRSTCSRRRRPRRRSTSTTRPAISPRSSRGSSAPRGSRGGGPGAARARGVAVALACELPARRRSRSGAHVPGGETSGATPRVDEHDRVAERALELVPDGAVVSASNSLGAHLSERRRILSFPLRETPTGSSSTRPGRATSTASRRRVEAGRARSRRLRRRRALAARLRARTACSSSGGWT